jgi:hypothetical protein
VGHTDLCVDEAAYDLQSRLVFAQAAPEARGYWTKLWRRYVSTARARRCGMRFRRQELSYSTATSILQISAKADLDWNTRRGAGIDGSHFMLKRDRGGGRDGG